mgnify:CR=1 FL=1
MSIFAYYNGVFGSFDEIRIPLSDRAVFFGDGVYDAALAAGDKIYLLDRHINSTVIYNLYRTLSQGAIYNYYTKS